MWRMTPQNPPVIKTITSTEQFDYLKKQLSIYYFPSSFYQEKVDKRLRLIGGYTYLITVLAVFTFPQPYSRRFAIAIIIISIIPRLYELYTLQLQKYKLSRYQNEVDKKEYFITQGTIQKIQQWNKTLKQLKLEISFQTLDGSSLIRVFNIPYPQFDTIKATYDPEKLIGQTVELCLLPQSYLLLQIQIIPDCSHELEFIHIKTGLFFRQNQQWSLHQQGILIQESVCTFDVQQISFNRLIDKPTFIIQLHCNNASDFHISSELSNFPIFERALFECFEEIDFNFYQKLKYSNPPQQQEIWHSPFPSLSAEQKHKQNQQLEHSIGLCVGICIVVSFIVMFSIHIIIGVMSLISSFIILMTFYFYHLNSRKYFDYYQHPHL